MRWAVINAKRAPVKQGPEAGKVKLFLTGQDGRVKTFNGYGRAKRMRFLGPPFPWPRPLRASSGAQIEMRIRLTGGREARKKLDELKEQIDRTSRRLRR